MAKFYLRELGRSMIVRDIGSDPVPDPEQDESALVYEIWDEETDSCKFAFEGEDAEKRAKAKLRSLKGGKDANSDPDSGGS